MLNEVRKAAFSLRKNKSKDTTENNEEEEEDNNNVENNNNMAIMISEEWESWYPQEWLGWCRYGVPSDDPTQLWVTATITDGPVNNETPLKDEGKNKKDKKSIGRASQRDRGMSSLSETKQNHEKNTLLAHHSYQVDEELRINSSNHDLKLIQLIKERASSDAERDMSNVLMDRYIKQEQEMLIERLNAKDALLQRKKEENSIMKSTPITLPTTTQKMVPSHETSSHVECGDDYDEEETTFECTPFEAFYAAIQPESYIREFNPPASYSGQFSPSSQGDGESASSQGDFTEPTAPYDVSQPLSNIFIQPRSIAENTEKLIRHASLPCSSFSVQATSTSCNSGVSRPPLPTRNNPSSVTLQPSRKYVTRSSPANEKKTASVTNPFLGKDWEYINTLLHKKYHIHHSNPGVITQENFNIFL
jgi:hypothetical protein